MDELELVKQVELKLLLITDPQQFQQAVGLYLCPLLLKLASDRHDVRATVLKVLQGVNPRLTGVPLDKLLAQLGDPALPPLVKQVNLFYVKKGLPGVNLAAKLANGLALQPSEIASVQFSYFLTALGTSEPNFSLGPDDTNFLLQWATKLLMLDLKASPSPGLTLSDQRFFVDLSEAKLSMAKVKLVQWLGHLAESESVPALSLYTPLLVAQDDRLSEVYGPAKNLFKNLALKEPPAELADLVVATRLRSPARSSLCVRILDLFSKHPEVPFPILEAVKPALASPDHRWGQAALALLRRSTLDTTTRKALCAQLHDYIYLLENSYGGSDAVRASAYETLGVLIADYDLTLLSFLLQKLERDSLTLVSSIQSAISAFKSPPLAALPELEALLVRVFRGSDRDATKLSCLKLGLVFPFEHAPVRLMGLLVQQPEVRSDVQDEGRRATDPYYFAREHPGDLSFPSLASMLLLEPAPSGPVAAFLFKCAAQEAGVQVPFDSKFERTFWATVQHDEAAAAKLSVAGEAGLFAPLFPLVVQGLIADNAQSTLVWSLLLRYSGRATLQGQQNLVPQLVGALDGGTKVPVSVLAESVALMHPDPSALDFVEKPQSALLFAYLVRLRGIACPPSLYKYCLDAKLWDALYQLALASAIENPLALVDVGTSEAQMSLLGALSLGTDPKPFLDKLLAVNQNSKNIDYLLANGEAVAMCVAGWASKLLRSRKETPPRELVPTLKTVFAQARSSAVIRRYACVRLLCLVQYCDVLEYTSDFQRAFLTFLSDSDEISQECASQGLGILYEQNPRGRKDMVRELVAMFTGEHKPLQRGRISEETQLFEPGALPTGQGSVSTYKDVLSLANEVGDSSLVYKFMSLASSSQIWSTKRGAAFGLESIMAKAEVNLDHLVPKLFRYQFDSNKQVQTTMKNIWDAVVKDRQRAVSDHFDAIVAELFSGSTNYEWRVREASASAFTNLVETTDWNQLREYTEELWNTGFRMVDDIKDSVRVAGFGLTKALVASLVRRLDSDARGNEELLATLVPFLFSTKGVHNDSEEVRAFALGALLKIARSSSRDVKPLRVSMMQQFVLLLSDLEPQALNYIALNSANYGVEDDQVDHARLQGVKSSPISDTVQQMIESLKGDELNELMAAWPTVVQRAVGLPSEIGASNVVVSLCLRFPTGDTTALIKACLKQLNNRNPAVAQSYATALAYLARLSSLEKNKELIEHVATTYFSADEDAPRLVAAQCLSAFSKHASDKFGALSSLVLPWAFIGKTDGAEPVAKTFGAAWDENTGSESLRLYAREIVDMALPHVSSTSWNIRKAAATALAAALVHAKGDPAPLLAAMQGRTWPGKELLFAALCQTSRWTGVQPSEALKSRVLNELQRNNLEYVVAILPSTVVLLEHQFDLEIYSLFFSKLNELFADQTDDCKVELFEAAVKAVQIPAATKKPSPILPFDQMYSSWKLKQAVCTAIAALAPFKGRYFDDAVWAKCCAQCGRDPSELVRLAWVGAAKALGELESPVVAEILANEQSPAVRAKAGERGV